MDGTDQLGTGGMVAEEQGDAARSVSDRDGPRLIPWSALLALIEPFYPKAENGRPPHPMARMLRIYFMAAVVQSVGSGHGRRAVRQRVDARLCRTGSEPGRGARRVDDSALPASAGEAQVDRGDVAQVRQLLEQKGLLLKSGTIVDATIVAAPPSTKNAAGQRDPEMRQTRQGKDWYFGMKLHVGTTKQGWCTVWPRARPTRPTSPAWTSCCNGQESELYGDQAYWSQDHRLQVQARRHPLSGQPASERKPSSERTRTRHQPQPFAPTCSRRTRLSHRQAAVGLCQGCAIAACTKTRCAPSRCSHWPTCTWPAATDASAGVCATDCAKQRPEAMIRDEKRTPTAARDTPRRRSVRLIASQTASSAVLQSFPRGCYRSATANSDRRKHVVGRQ